ncbi:MAG: SIMPL domain-containing protein [Balneolaceae bacterium]|nr:SIMPL domain-containing protein [Balneolaceae bacterium]
MKEQNNRNFWILGISIFLGLTALGYLLGNAAITFKEYERSVTVKGLSEQEHTADIVIWPIQFTEASNSLSSIYASLETSEKKVQNFLIENGIHEDEISVSTPSVTDKSAQQYGGAQSPEFRYVANQTVTVYSAKVLEVRAVMDELAELGKQGVALTGDQYQARTEYLFNSLNDIKPQMIEESTKEARKVAQKFAEDSNSELGKIKTAYQGQFSIRPRDKNNPHIKKIRVVSTVVYYLSD